MNLEKSIFECIRCQNSNVFSTPKIYVSYHPNDLNKIKEFSQIIGDKLDVDIYFLKYPLEKEISSEELEYMLNGVQLFVVIATHDYLNEKNNGKDLELKFILKGHLPFLPIIYDKSDIESFNLLTHNSQFIYLFEEDNLKEPPEVKIVNFISNHVVSSELYREVLNELSTYLFFSYRKKDGVIAHELMNRLHQVEELIDIGLWYDEFLTYGQDFDQEITKKIVESERVIFCATNNILEEDNYVKKYEYKAAKDNNIPMISIKVDDLDVDAFKEMYPLADTPKDIEDIIDCLKDNFRDAKNDSPKHLYYLGVGYVYGINVIKDVKLGMSLLEQAEKQGVVEASEELCKIYEYGIGVLVNYESLFFHLLRVITGHINKGNKIRASFYISEYINKIYKYNFDHPKIIEIIMTLHKFMDDCYVNEKEYLYNYVFFLRDALRIIIEFGDDYLKLCDETNSLIAKVDEIYECLKGDSNGEINHSFLITYFNCLQLSAQKRNYDDMTKYADKMLALDISNVRSGNYFMNNIQRLAFIHRVFVEVNHPDADKKYLIEGVEDETDLISNPVLKDLAKAQNKVKEAVSKKDVPNIIKYALEMFELTKVKLIEAKSYNDFVGAILEIQFNSISYLRLYNKGDVVIANKDYLLETYKKYMDKGSQEKEMLAMLYFYLYEEYKDMKEESEGFKYYKEGFKFYLDYFNSLYKHDTIGGKCYFAQKAIEAFDQNHALADLLDIVQDKQTHLFSRDIEEVKLSINQEIFLFEIIIMLLYKSNEIEKAREELTSEVNLIFKLFENPNDLFNFFPSVFWYAEVAALAYYPDDVPTYINTAIELCKKYESTVEKNAFFFVLKSIYEMAIKIMIEMKDITGVAIYSVRFINDCYDAIISKEQEKYLPELMNALSYSFYFKKTGDLDPQHYYELYINTYEQLFEENKAFIFDEGINYTFDVINCLRNDYALKILQKLFNTLDAFEIINKLFEFRKPLLISRVPVIMNNLYAISQFATFSDEFKAFVHDKLENFREEVDTYPKYIDIYNELLELF